MPEVRDGPGGGGTIEDSGEWMAVRGEQEGGKKIRS
jgi:hypothetical protein